MNINKLSDLVGNAKVIEIIQSVHPKYDKYLHSKVKRTNEYGICLSEKALKKLEAVYVTRRRKTRGRFLPNVIKAKHKNDEYGLLQQAITVAVRSVIKDWINEIVIEALKEQR